MTTTITVAVPEKASWKAKVEHIDTVGGEGKASLAGIVPPGESATFYAHSTREVVISELALDASNGHDPAPAVAETAEA